MNFAGLCKFPEWPDPEIFRHKLILCGSRKHDYAAGTQNDAVLCLLKKNFAEYSSWWCAGVGGASGRRQAVALGRTSPKTPSTSLGRTSSSEQPRFHILFWLEDLAFEYLEWEVGEGWSAVVSGGEGRSVVVDGDDGGEASERKGRRATERRRSHNGGRRWRWRWWRRR